jgi:hypothetical protein
MTMPAFFLRNQFERNGMLAGKTWKMGSWLGTMAGVKRLLYAPKPYGVTTHPTTAGTFSFARIAGAIAWLVS